MWDPHLEMSRRPLVPERVYHFNIIYNHAWCPLSRTEDTDLAIRVTTSLVERLELRGYVNSYYYDRDHRTNTSFVQELERVLNGSSVTILLVTPGFIHDCLDSYFNISAFKRFLEASNANWKLITLSVGVPKEQMPCQLTTSQVFYFQEDWEVDISTWSRFDDVVGSKLSGSSKENWPAGVWNNKELDNENRVGNFYKTECSQERHYSNGNGKASVSSDLPGIQKFSDKCLMNCDCGQCCNLPPRTLSFRRTSSKTVHPEKPTVGELNSLTSKRHENNGSGSPRSEFLYRQRTHHLARPDSSQLCSSFGELSRHNSENVSPYFNERFDSLSSCGQNCQDSRAETLFYSKHCTLSAGSTCTTSPEPILKTSMSILNLHDSTSTATDLPVTPVSSRKEETSYLNNSRMKQNGCSLSFKDDCVTSKCVSQTHSMNARRHRTSKHVTVDGGILKDVQTDLPQETVYNRCTCAMIGEWVSHCTHDILARENGDKSRCLYTERYKMSGSGRGLNTTDTQKTRTLSTEYNNWRSMSAQEKRDVNIRPRNSVDFGVEISDREDILRCLNRTMYGKDVDWIQDGADSEIFDALAIRTAANLRKRPAEHEKYLPTHRFEILKSNFLDSCSVNCNNTWEPYDRYHWLPSDYNQSEWGNLSGTLINTDNDNQLSTSNSTGSLIRTRKEWDFMGSSGVNNPQVGVSKKIFTENNSENISSTNFSNAYIKIGEERRSVIKDALESDSRNKNLALLNNKSNTASVFLKTDESNLKNIFSDIENRTTDPSQDQPEPSSPRSSMDTNVECAQNNVYLNQQLVNNVSYSDIKDTGITQPSTFTDELFLVTGQESINEQKHSPSSTIFTLPAPDHIETSPYQLEDSWNQIESFKTELPQWIERIPTQNITETTESVLDHTPERTLTLPLTTTCGHPDPNTQHEHQTDIARHVDVASRSPEHDNVFQNYHLEYTEELSKCSTCETSNDNPHYETQDSDYKSCTHQTIQNSAVQHNLEDASNAGATFLIIIPETNTVTKSISLPPSAAFRRDTHTLIPECEQNSSMLTLVLKSEQDSVLLPSVCDQGSENAQNNIVAYSEIEYIHNNTVPTPDSEYTHNNSIVASDSECTRDIITTTLGSEYSLDSTVLRSVGGCTEEIIVPTIDSGCTEQTIVPTIDSGCTEETIVPTIDSGCTEQTIVPTIDSGCTEEIIVPTIDSGCTEQTIVPTIDSGCTEEIIVPTIDSGCTEETIAPTIDSGCTEETIVPTIDSGCTEETIAPTIDSGCTEEAIVPTIDSECTEEAIAPTMGSGCAEETIIPIIDSGCTEETISPTVDSGCTQETISPTIDSGCTEEIIAPTMGSGCTEETIVPTIDSGCTEETIVPIIDSGCTEETIVPTIDSGCTEETIVPIIDSGCTEEIIAPRIDSGCSEETVIPTSESGYTEEAIVPIIDSGCTEEIIAPTIDSGCSEETIIPTSESGYTDEAIVPTSDSGCTQENNVPRSNNESTHDNTVPTLDSKSTQESNVSGSNSSECTENNTVPTSDSKVTKDHLVPTSDNESTEDNTVPTLYSERTQGNTDPILDSESTQDNTVPTLDSESIQDNTVPTLDSESTQDNTVPTLDSESPQDNTVPTSDSESTQDNTVPTLDSESTQDNTVPTLDSESTQDNTVPTLDSESIQDNTVPTLDSESTQDNTVPTLDSESPQHNTVPTSDSESTQDNTVPTLDSESTQDNTVPTLDSKSTQDNTVPTLDSESTQDNTVPTSDSESTQDNTVPTLDSESTQDNTVPISDSERSQDNTVPILDSESTQDNTVPISDSESTQDKAGPILDSESTLDKAGPILGSESSQDKVGPVLDNESTQDKAGPILGSESTQDKVGPVLDSESTQDKAGPILDSESTQDKAGPILDSESTQDKAGPILDSESTQDKAGPVLDSESTQDKAGPVLDSESTQDKAGPVLDSESTQDKAGPVLDSESTLDKAGPILDSESTQDKTGPILDSESTQDKAGPVLDSESTQDKSGPVLDSESTQDKAGPVLDSESTQDKAGPVLDSESTQDKAGPVLDSESTQDKAGPVLDSESTQDKAGPVLDNESTQNKAGPILDSESTQDKAGPILDNKSTQDKAGPILDSESTQNKAGPILDSESTQDKAGPVLDSKCAQYITGLILYSESTQDNTVPIIDSICTHDNIIQSSDSECTQDGAIPIRACESAQNNTAPKSDIEWTQNSTVSISVSKCTHDNFVPSPERDCIQGTDVPTSDNEFVQDNAAPTSNSEHSQDNTVPRSIPEYTQEKVLPDIVSKLKENETESTNIIDVGVADEVNLTFNKCIGMLLSENMQGTSVSDAPRVQVSTLDDSSAAEDINNWPSAGKACTTDHLVHPAEDVKYAAQTCRIKEHVDQNSEYAVTLLSENIHVDDVDYRMLPNAQNNTILPFKESSSYLLASFQMNTEGDSGYFEKSESLPQVKDAFQQFVNQTFEDVATDSVVEQTQESHPQEEDASQGYENEATSFFLEQTQESLPLVEDASQQFVNQAFEDVSTNYFVEQTQESLPQVEDTSRQFINEAYDDVATNFFLEQTQESFPLVKNASRQFVNETFEDVAPNSVVEQTQESLPQVEDASRQFVNQAFEDVATQPCLEQSINDGDYYMSNVYSELSLTSVVRTSNTNECELILSEHVSKQDCFQEVFEATMDDDCFSAPLEDCRIAQDVTFGMDPFITDCTILSDSIVFVRKGSIKSVGHSFEQITGSDMTSDDVDCADNNSVPTNTQNDCQKIMTADSSQYHVDFPVETLDKTEECSLGNVSYQVTETNNTPKMTQFLRGIDVEDIHAELKTVESMNLTPETVEGSAFILLENDACNSKCLSSGVCTIRTDQDIDTQETCSNICDRGIHDENTFLSLPSTHVTIGPSETCGVTYDRFFMTSATLEEVTGITLETCSEHSQLPETAPVQMLVKQSRTNEEESPEMELTGMGNATESEEVDWKVPVFKGVCHVLSTPDMPYLG